MTKMAATADAVANTPENQENGQSETLHEAATTIQLSALILTLLQKSVHDLQNEGGVCQENGMGSTKAILKSVAKVTESYKPMIALIGTENGVEELEATVDAINNAVGVLETFGEVTESYKPMIALIGTENGVEEW